VRRYDPRGVADCVAEVVAAMTEVASGRAVEELVPGTAPHSSQATCNSFVHLFISFVVAHKAALFAVPSLVHEHTRAAVQETKQRLSSHWKL
jgi:hypothetical protein